MNLSNPAYQPSDVTRFLSYQFDSAIFPAMPSPTVRALQALVLERHGVSVSSTFIRNLPKLEAVTTKTQYIVCQTAAETVAKWERLKQYAQTDNPSPTPQEGAKNAENPAKIGIGEVKGVVLTLLFMLLAWLPSVAQDVLFPAWPLPEGHYLCEISVVEQVVVGSDTTYTTRFHQADTVKVDGWMSAAWDHPFTVLHFLHLKKRTAFIYNKIGACTIFDMNGYYKLEGEKIVVWNNFPGNAIRRFVFTPITL